VKAPTAVGRAEGGWHLQQQPKLTQNYQLSTHWLKRALSWASIP
jgi:hypothetical protein